MPETREGDQALAHILLIEDDDGTADEVTLDLQRCGHRVDRSTNGKDALSIGRGPFDAMVVDRLLPDCEGLDVIKALRNAGVRTPALVVSALGGLDDRVRGLRAGGDDYLPKPFALVELVARLEALLRRPVEIRETFLRLGPLEIDFLSRTARRNSIPLELLSRELDVLEYLMRRPGQTVTRSMLLQDVWGYRFEPRSNVVDVHMSKLRRKVDGTNDIPLIRNVRGLGYRLDEPR